MQSISPAMIDLMAPASRLMWRYDTKFSPPSGEGERDPGTPIDNCFYTHNICVQVGLGTLGLSQSQAKYIETYNKDLVEQMHDQDQKNNLQRSKTTIHLT